MKFHSKEPIINCNCMAFYLLTQHHSLFSKVFRFVLLTALCYYEQSKTKNHSFSVFLRKKENTTVGAPLGNSCEIAHATVNETVKSRLFSLITGFKTSTKSHIPQPCTDILPVCLIILLALRQLPYHGAKLTNISYLTNA